MRMNEIFQGFLKSRRKEKQKSKTGGSSSNEQTPDLNSNNVNKHEPEVDSEGFRIRPADDPPPLPTRKSEANHFDSSSSEESGTFFWLGASNIYNM